MNNYLHEFLSNFITPTEQSIILGHSDPRKGKNMNENNHELVGDADTVATLLAANNGLPHTAAGAGGDGETTQQEATVFVGEDTTDIVEA